MRRIVQRILVLLCGLMAVGCTQSTIPNNESPQGDVQVLDLSVSIADGAVSKAPIEGTSFANGTHLFGLAVTQADELTAYESGSDHVWSSAVVAGSTQTWTYRWGSMSGAGAVLPKLSADTPMQVAGYYPYTASAVGLAGRDEGRLNVPFDLTTATEQSNQTDVLFSTAQALTYAPSGGDQRVSLLFRHVYALLEFQVKLNDASVSASITKVEVCNKAGKSFLSNKGFFSPYTGELTAQTAGNVSLTTSTALNGSTYATIRVMIPPTLLAGYVDGDIYVQLYDDGTAISKSLPILLNYLTQTGVYGFAGGGKYRFKLLYDNRGSGSLTVEEWSQVLVPDEALGFPLSLGALAQSPANDLAAAGATVTVSSPNASTGLDWTAALSNTTGFALGAVTGSGATGAVPVVVGLNPTNAVRSSILTATGSSGQASSIELRQAASSLSYASLSATTPVAASATSVTFTVTGTAGLTLSFAKTSGDAAFSAPSPATLTCDGSAQTVTVAMTANAAEDREAVYTATVTNAGASGLDLTDITVKQTGLYVKIDNLYWAKGNLVGSGSNGCKIGAPTDCGVYFQFGSLVGWAGGKTGNGVGTGSPELSVNVKPSGYSGNTSWPAGYYASGMVDTQNYDLPSTDVAATGIGDPCRHYLGGAWRTPTAAQWLTLIGADGANMNAGLPLKHKSYELYFSDGGMRSYSSGVFTATADYGYMWSSSAAGVAQAWNMYFDNSAILKISSVPAAGFPVRCVRPV